MRGRPKGSRNLSSLREQLIIPKAIEKQIFALSQQSGMSPQQVLIDALQGGIINVRLFVYKELIQYRKSLREQLDGDSDLQEESDTASHGDTRNGQSQAELGGESPGSLPELPTDEERFDLAPVGPGLSSEGDAALNGDRGDAE